MCGFTDVRKRGDGTYYCQVCGREFEPTWRQYIEKFCGKYVALQLDSQCRTPPQTDARPK